MSGEEYQSTMDIDLTVYTRDADRIQMRQIAYGISPLVTLEPKVKNDRISLEITSSLLEQDELQELLEFIVEAFKSGEAPEPVEESK